MREIIIISAILMVVGMVLGALMGAIIACIANRNSVDDAYKLGFETGSEQMYDCVYEMIRDLEEKKDGKG